MSGFTTQMINLTNSTDNNSPSRVKYLENIWLASQCMNTVLLLISLWLIASVIVYGCRSGKFRKNFKTRSNGKLLVKVALICTLLLTSRIVLTQALIIVGFGTEPSADVDCEIVEDISIVFQGLNIVSAYTFLWLRQRSLYSQPPITRLKSFVTKCISVGCIVLIYAAGLGIVIAFSVPDEYISSGYGCLYVETDASAYQPIFYAFIAVLLIGQFSLLGLFLYPLYMHRRFHSDVVIVKPEKNDSRKNSAPLVVSIITSSKDDLNDDNSLGTPQKNTDQLMPPSVFTGRFQGSPRSNSGSRCSTPALKSKVSVDKNGKPGRIKTSKRISDLMVKSAILTFVCVLTDMIALLVDGFITPPHTPVSFVNLFYDFSLTVNTISVIAQLADYKKVLLSPAVILLRNIFDCQLYDITPMSQSTVCTSKEASKVDKVNVLSTDMKAV